MELGEKLRAARLEAGLSQRQLCGDTITRNMLSLIEHGSAKPSMDTLKLLAARLEKPVSFFLEEDTLVSLNQQVMTRARACHDIGDWAGALEALEAYREGDEVYDREMALLRKRTYLELAEEAIREKRRPYAMELLEKAKADVPYCGEALERKRLMLWGQGRKPWSIAAATSSGLKSPSGPMSTRASSPCRKACINGSLSPS